MTRVICSRIHSIARPNSWTAGAPPLSASESFWECAPKEFGDCGVDQCNLIMINITEIPFSVYPHPVPSEWALSLSPPEESSKPAKLHSHK